MFTAEESSGLRLLCSLYPDALKGLEEEAMTKMVCLRSEINGKKILKGL